jgi:hypothetical protein
MTKELGNEYNAMLQTFTTADDRSYGVFNMLQDVYPAFAQKLFQGNDIMQRIVMSGFNPMDILDYPICGKCETLAPFDGYGIKYGKTVNRCTCMSEKCGHSTLDPVTLRDWMKYEMKKKVDPEFFEAIEVAIDMIAYTMLKKHTKELQDAINYKNGTDSQNNGIIMPDGSIHDVTIEHLREKPEEEIFE